MPELHATFDEFVNFLNAYFNAIPCLFLYFTFSVQFTVNHV